MVRTARKLDERISWHTLHDRLMFSIQSSYTEKEANAMIKEFKEFSLSYANKSQLYTPDTLLADLISKKETLSTCLTHEIMRAMDPGPEEPQAIPQRGYPAMLYRLGFRTDGEQAACILLGFGSIVLPFREFALFQSRLHQPPISKSFRFPFNRPLPFVRFMLISSFCPVLLLGLRNK